MEQVKNRTLEVGQEVFVYFNLHKKVFSVKDVKTGLVVAHTETIALEDVTFKVSEAGRQRVLKEQRKNVHAGVRGKYTGTLTTNQLGREATYNPYKFSSFVDKSSEEPLKEARVVHLENKKVYYL
jgi:hypothetical protein